MPDAVLPPPLPSGAADGQEDGKPPWGFWATFGMGVAIVVAFTTIQSLIMMMMVFVLFGKDGFGTVFENMETLVFDGRILSLSMAVSFPVMVFGCVFFILLRKGIRVRDYLALRPMPWAWWVVLPPLTLGFTYLLGWLMKVAGAPETNEWMLLIGKASVGNPFVWIGIVLFAPIAEEILFRGFLHEGWVKTRLRLGGTIFLTALGWALIHAQYDLYGLAFIFILGIALGVVRWKTNSIYGPILVHAVNNAIAMTMIMKALEAGA